MVKTKLSRQIFALSESSAIKAVKRKRGPTVTISRAEGSGKSAWAWPGHSNRARRSGKTHFIGNLGGEQEEEKKLRQKELIAVDKVEEKEVKKTKVVKKTKAVKKT